MRNPSDKSLFGMGNLMRQKVVDRFRDHARENRDAADGIPTDLRGAGTRDKVPEAYTQFARHVGYERLRVSQTAAERLGIANPFFNPHDILAGATTRIRGREYINFSSYNYLGLNGHPGVNRAAAEAINRYGTSASASRLVAGERPVHRELEHALARFYGVDDTLVFVSGHATNVSTIGYLFGRNDLVVHDALIHNSVIEGIKLAGAHRRLFPHNDFEALDRLLTEVRPQFERVLIVIEGLYSMDGDIPDLRRFVEVKSRHAAFLMVDEAHSLGVLGERGHGIAEHFHVPTTSVDIWMGTLSKSLAGCGGFIAGEQALIEHLRYAAPGFVYSVGMSPPVAAAALEALRLLESEPERVERLQQRGRFLLEHAQELGLDCGLSQGYAITPAIIGSSLKAAKLSNELLERGINVQPIIHPAVEEQAARLRFFVSSQHSEEQILVALRALRELT